MEEKIILDLGTILAMTTVLDRGLCVLYDNKKTMVAGGPGV